MTPKLRVTVSQAFLDELAQARAALSHKFPAGGFEDVMREGLRLIMKEHAKRRGGVPAGRDGPGGAGDRSHVPIAVQREVWRRDDGRCTYVAPDGTRCASRHQLQLDHATPVAFGGEDTVPNLRLLCAAHNRHAAAAILGEVFMERCMRAGRGPTSAGGSEPLTREPGVSASAQGR